MARLFAPLGHAVRSKENNIKPLTIESPYINDLFYFMNLPQSVNKYRTF